MLKEMLKSDWLSEAVLHCSLAMQERSFSGCPASRRGGPPERFTSGTYANHLGHSSGRLNL